MTGQPNISVSVANSASFGFSFILEANGGGNGTNPKTYAINNPASFDLKGTTDDNAPGVTVTWPSDPSDFPSPTFPLPPSRQYDAGVSPNNIRLSQVSISSLVATHGIRSNPVQASLPNSFGFGKSPFVAPGPQEIIGDLQGLRRTVVSLLQRVGNDPLAPTDRVLLCNSVMLAGGPSLANLAHVFEFTNLGTVQIVNLSPVRLVIGVHCELSM